MTGWKTLHQCVRLTFYSALKLLILRSHQKRCERFAQRDLTQSKARGCGDIFFWAAHCEDSPLDEIFGLLAKFHTSGQSAVGCSASLSLNQNKMEDALIVAVCECNLL